MPGARRAGARDAHARRDEGGRDSIAYVANDGNVWLTTPDGQRKAQVTADAGSPLSGARTKRYVGPAQRDSRTVIVPDSDR